MFRYKRAKDMPKNCFLCPEMKAKQEHGEFTYACAVSSCILLEKKKEEEEKANDDD